MPSSSMMVAYWLFARGHEFLLQRPVTLYWFLPCMEMDLMDLHAWWTWQKQIRIMKTRKVSNVHMIHPIHPDQVWPGYRSLASASSTSPWRSKNPRPNKPKWFHRCAWPQTKATDKLPKHQNKTKQNNTTLTQPLRSIKTAQADSSWFNLIL